MNLTATLSTSSLERLEADLRAYAARVGTAAGETAVELGGIAAEAARKALSGTEGTGDLASSISVVPTAKGADVVAASDHAAFVEFGTGIGMESGNALDLAAAAGGGYYIDEKGRGDAGWAFPSKRDGGFYTTHGQDGKGYMAEGAEEARRRVVETARKAVRS